MSTLIKESIAMEVWFDEDNIWLRLDDGRQVGVPPGFYPRLLQGTKEQRASFEFSGQGRGLHWPELDEDLLVDGIIRGIPDNTHK